MPTRVTMQSLFASTAITFVVQNSRDREQSYKTQKRQQNSLQQAYCV